MSTPKLAELAELVAQINDAEIGKAVRYLLPDVVEFEDEHALVVMLVGWLRQAVKTRHLEGGASNNGSSPVVPSVGAVPVEVPGEVEFDFALTNTIANAVLNGPGEWIGNGVELAGVASMVREKVKPLIAARVRAEAAAAVPSVDVLIEEAARQRRWSVQGVSGGPLYEGLPDWHKAEYRRAVQQTVELVAGRLVAAHANETARVRAEERQRIADLIQQNAGTLDAFARDGSTAGLIAYLIGDLMGAGSAAPVATPEPTTLMPADCTCLDDGGCIDYYDESRPGDCGYCIASGAGTENGPCPAVLRIPVATPTEPVDEVKCPNCEATIRARMSDAPAEQDGSAG